MGNLKKLQHRKFLGNSIFQR